MSTTTPTGQNHLADVASYATAVRRQLVGLSAEQVEDLTDGLEADLADALADPLATPREAADGADLTARFGSPAAYAQELRAAAGLPDAGAPPKRRRMRNLLTAPVRTGARTARDVLDRLRQRPWWPPVEEFLVTLTPAVWLVRGWLVAQVVSVVLRALVPDGGSRGAWLPTTFLDWLLLVGLCVVSVQWGRGRWQGGRSSRRARLAATAVAVIAALPVFVTNAAHDARTQNATGVEYQTIFTPTAPQDGVVVAGMLVSNLFAYDAAGNPIDGVQIFDDRGRPVRTTSDDGSGEWSLPGVADRWSFVSAQDEGGRQLWNVYPLRGGPTASFEWNDLGQRVLTGGVTPRTPPRPFAKAPAVTLPGATTGTAKDTTTGTGTATDAPDAAPPAPTSAAAPGAEPSGVPSAGSGEVPSAVPAPSTAPLTVP